MKRAALLLLALACGAARADGLADLKAALAGAAGASAFKAQVETRTWRKLGEGKEAEEESGQAGVTLDDGARALAVSYGKSTLARIEGELRSKGKNPNSKTPTLTALAEIDTRELLALTSAAGALARSIERDAYKGERADSWQGAPARVLTFDAPITGLSERQRKYAKTYSDVLEVWIGADGMPLASRTRMSMTGRAFVVVGFAAQHEENCVYGSAGDRLLVLRKESRDSSSGAGEREERKVLTTLQVLP